MLEGNELEGKIGENGSYSVDVAANGRVDAKVNFALQKEIVPGLDVALTVDGNIKMRTSTLVAAQAAKSDNKILQYVAKLLATIDDGEETHPELVAALEAHASPVAKISSPVEQA